VSLDAPTDEASDARVPTRNVNPWLRVAFVVVMVATLWIVVTVTGLDELLHEEQLREVVVRFGAWGAVIFFAAFVLGQFMHLPGVLFIAAATFAWGPLAGGFMSLLGATLAVSANFYVVRRVGGGALADMRRPMLIRVLSSLHRRPRATMFAARAIFNTSAVLTTMCALSGVRLRDHAIASAVGMMVPILGWAFVLETVVF